MSARWISWKSILGVSLLAALVIFAEFRWLRERQQAQRITWANEQVESQLAAARMLLTEQHWDEAIHRLEETLDIDEAANRDAVRPLLEEARRGQAEALLDAARIALTHRHPMDALRLLRAYLAHPQAAHIDRARLLRAELERALSDDEAAKFLAGLSNEALTVFADKGQLTVDDGMQTAATKALFQKTLRRHLAAEQSKREAQREVTRLTETHRAEERVRRIERLRETPSFHSLSTFLAQIQEQLREQQQIASRQDAELHALFRELNVTDTAEQQQIRADLLGLQPAAVLREQIERKRAEVKGAYRKENESSRFDADLFDRLVDHEVDQFLKKLASDEHG